MSERLRRFYRGHLAERYFPKLAFVMPPRMFVTIIMHLLMINSESYTRPEIC